MSEGKISLTVRIRGRVQGVGFRAWTVQEARQLGLEGSIRNEADGSVVAVISGSEPSVAAMVERLRKGPIGASVSSLETETVALAELPTGFHVKR